MKHQILFEHLGEYSYTPKSPRRIFENDVDLDTKTTHTILGYDDFRPCPVQRYEVQEVELPDWLTPQEWLREHVRWGFVWNAHPDVKGWPESWQRFLLTLDEYRREAAVKLLATKSFRSEFRQSLRDQLEDWLAGNRSYQSPFSTRQWQALMRDAR